ncbi:NADP-dependent isocitrate dehydrogenase [Dermatophilus congolensis]|uniref:NADP-dependent isocitrate dehydrogenase n=1 Tax=Dermatophilus congolensis TaxID=1863 RepID=UPI001AB00BBA|nr:NADP-dependent isocitrate dehydrogenase [Dermatophilus congolensis]MBO3132830.1 NADP-dependent isocitrate dehydrogenase [Dermatophilus congolensis]MBO3133011.1 NADP-dependent isocitrate dehydrogenase [Dermatophilus congolensis]MBO3135247.1 NADP-dependent isocitrate dehydrogenase [Dermatophilus congolensis]MBO3137485.1 NADP-dependent isocitrate dehydrogenase [Dermatophilus congolensis]
MSSKIVWTLTDEAPALATFSLLPIVRAFVKAADVEVETSDISLSGRILAQFPERLTDEQSVPDYLAVLGEWTQDDSANIIKLPNISASVPQLKAAIRELQDQGFAVPDFPVDPSTDEERDVSSRYAKVLGSAVNPVLREGNSDRRAPASVKAFAQRHPHRLREWDAGTKARVAHMSDGDFYGNEQSVVTAEGCGFEIRFTNHAGEARSLVEGLQASPGEVLDGTFMSVSVLQKFYAEQIEEAKRDDLLLSLHLKATMMKVSDPVLFGHAVKVFFVDVFAEFGDELREVGVNPNLGLGDLLSAIQELPDETRKAIEKAIAQAFAERPALAMVDSDKGITNLHAPNDVIVDASMPVVVRDGGQMWNAKGERQATLAMIPDRSYSTMYAAIMEDCRINGALDPATMGDVPNVGLMAKKAEEYGSHPTTFVMSESGKVEVIAEDGSVLMSHDVEAGDIWRMARTQDVSVRDWVRLAVERARLSGTPAVFWLDSERAHDANLIAKVREYLGEHDTSGLSIEILAPVEAMKFTLERIRRGENTISVTGNVLRDYLTDLFPILELGTSAKMLSVVPLLAGGGLFETGAGGSAPKHVQQFVNEGYLRWDSLGEFSALGASLEHVANRSGNPKAQVLADALDRAISRFLEENKSPARIVGEIDNRGSHFYLALFWAQELAGQSVDAELSAKFAAVADELSGKAGEIDRELIAAQGVAVDLGGYFRPDVAKVEAAMRPSGTLNTIIDAL